MEQVRHASLHCLSLWIHIHDHDEAELLLSVQELIEQIHTTAYAILSKATLTATDSAEAAKQVLLAHKAPPPMPPSPSAEGVSAGED